MTSARDRIWTIPNMMSFARLLGVPVFLWFLLAEQADGWAPASATGSMGP